LTQRAKIKPLLPLITILVISLAARVFYAFKLSGISGGDIFDFLLITKKLVAFENPFISKRLPFYPLLLIPGHITGYPIIWGKILGIIFATSSLYVIYLLGRKLNINKWALYLAMLATSFQGYFFIFSLRPLTHTLFNFEVLLSVYLFYKLVSNSNNRTLRVKNSEPEGLRDYKLPILFGVTLGLMSMTRHEGFVVSAVLLFLLFLFNIDWKNIKKTISYSFRVSLTAFLPFILIIAPFFISNLTRYGSLTYTEYYEDRGVNRVETVQSLKENFETTKWIILNLWGDVPIFPIKKILVPVFLLLLFGLLLRDHKLNNKKMFGWAQPSYFYWIIVLSFYWIISQRVPFEGDLYAFGNFILASLMFTGIIKIFVDLKWESLPLLLVVISQTLLLMVIQPWPRHMQHTFPFYAIFLALGITWLINLKNLKFKIYNLKYINSILYIIFFVFVAFNLSRQVSAGVSGHNRGILDEKPIMEAAIYARDNLEGVIGFESDATWIRYYMSDKARYFTTGLEIPPENRDYMKTVSEQIDWIQKNRLNYVVNYSEWEGLSVVKSKFHVGDFELVEEFETERDGKSYYVGIYEVL